MRTQQYAPHAAIEDHHHIQDLIAAQDKRHEDRTITREREAMRHERDEEIKKTQMVVLTDFFCSTCRIDFKSVSIKQWEVDWSNASQHIAFYKTKCDKGHWCIRHITDKQKDGFYVRSKLMALDRGNHYADTIQPWETGFNMLYKKLK